MDPKRIVSLVLLAGMFLLPGCSRMYDREYLSITEYVPAEQTDNSSTDRLRVRDFAGLKQAILTIVSSEDGKGTIRFDPSYSGDAVEDMASACWQVRTQDALCAYCVENIAYELDKIVSYYEAELSVTYSRAIENAGGIVHMNYATGVDEVITEALQSGKRKLVLLIGRSSYTAENMESLVEQVYRLDPALSPRLPLVEVNLYSGNEQQRLFEIKLGYGMVNAELQSRREAVQALQPFETLDVERLSQQEQAREVCRYLMENCLYTGDLSQNSVYDALILGRGDSEALAYACVALCCQLGLNCRMVNGQYNWQEHWWNMVEIDGSYYHMDLSRCLSAGLEAGFLLNDESIWPTHRWDTSAYPKCSGEALVQAE